MSRAKSLLALTAITMAICAAVSNAGGPPGNEAAATLVKEYLDRLANFDYHGAVLAARGGDVLIHEAYGLADVQTGATNTTETLFSTGSVTKQFTATAILRLEMEGKVSTQDPITRYFDNVPKDKEAITIHHLLTHAAGLRGSYGPDEESITRDDLVRKVLGEPLEFPVGERYEYSNAGYSLAAAIVERVSGMEYEAFLRETFFLPNGMKSTGLELIDLDGKQVSRSHTAELGYPSPDDRPDDCWYLKGNGGILSTTMDMYRWHRAIQGTGVLSAKAKEKMFTPHVREYEDGESFYGYGWVVENIMPGKTMIWHNGGAMPHGWGCSVYYLVEDDAYFVEFSNKPMGDRHPGDFIVMNLARILMGREYTMPPAVASVPARDIEPLAGTYALPEGGALHVTAGDGKLRVSPRGQKALDVLFPSRFAPHLPKYNGKTQDVVERLAAGDVDSALEHFSEGMASHDEWKEMIEAWWQSLDSLGTYQGCDVIGTKGGDGAQTYCRLKFTNGAVVCRFFWMRGRCGGMSAGVEPPAKDFVPQSKTRFNGFDLAGGRIVSAEFSPGGRVVVSAGDATLEARRE